MIFSIKDLIKNKTYCLLIFMFRYDKFSVLPGSNKVCFKHRVRGGTQQHTFCSLVYRHPGFFFFSTLCKNYSPDWSSTKCCAILLHNEANAELRKAGKKNS